MRANLRSLSLATLALSATAALAATALSLTDVNERVAKLLAPFNNPTTQGSVKFTALETNESNVLKFGVESHLSKTGKVNAVKLQLPNVNYAFNGPNGLPLFDATVRLEMDFLKSFPQNFLNSIAESAEDMIKDIAADFLKEYGDAAEVAQSVYIERTDTGSVTAMDITILVNIDLAQLPPSMPLSEAFLSKLVVKVKFDLQGGNLGLTAELNPKYKGFNEDSVGLKEVVDGLLSNDKKTYDDLEKLVQFVDGFAGELVDRKPEDN